MYAGSYNGKGGEGGKGREEEVVAGNLVCGQDKRLQSITLFYPFPPHSVCSDIRASKRKEKRLP